MYNKKHELVTLRQHMVPPLFFVESVLLIFFVSCVVQCFCLSFSCVLCIQCCQWLCIVHSSLPLRFSITFILLFFSLKTVIFTSMKTPCSRQCTYIRSEDNLISHVRSIAKTNIQHNVLVVKRKDERETCQHTNAVFDFH